MFGRYVTQYGEEMEVGENVIEELRALFLQPSKTHRFGSHCDVRHVIQRQLRSIHHILE